MKETKFKDTEVGKIPVDWEVKLLLKVLSIGNGKDYKKLPNGDVPVYGTGGYMTSVSEFLYDGPTVCIGRKGTIDKPIYHEGKIWTVDTLFYTYDFKGIDVKFLYYLFCTIEWHTYNEATGVPSLTAKNILNIAAPFPVLSEQQRIASALSNIDALIVELNKLIEKKRAIKQGAMQQLLTGKKRLKGFNEPWVEKTIGDCFEVYDGTHQTPYYVENGIPFYSVENVTANDFKHTKYISEEEHNLLTAKYRMRKGDVLMTRIGSIGVCKYIDWSVNASYYVSLALLKPKSNIHAPFFCFASTSKLFKDDIKLRSLLFAIPLKINLNEIAKVKFLCPQNITEQQAIASVLTSMDKEISAIEAKKAKYETIKQGMMQQLLTGKIRLVETSVRPNATSANVHFRRSVWAAEIAERLYEEPTFGHVKMEKMLFLTERLCHIDIGSHYHRDAAGPYDNNALRSIDSQLKKQKWFEVQRTEKGYRYVPMQNRGKHKIYFNRYYSGIVPMFDKIINTFKTQNTERCEIVATLYSAWEDLLHSNKSFTDANIVNEVLNNWHESKKRISQERWLKAIQWMRDNGFAPDMLS